MTTRELIWAPEQVIARLSADPSFCVDSAQASEPLKRS
jgi:hypothetical protein